MNSIYAGGMHVLDAAIDSLECKPTDSAHAKRRHEDFNAGWASAEFHHKAAIGSHDDLLAALEAIVEANTGGNWSLGDVTIARTAIAKAKGATA